MKRFSFNQKGVAHLKLIIPVVLVLFAVGAIGGYVYKNQSKANYSDARASAPYFACTDISLKRNGYVYASAIGTASKFKNAKNSDSIRNIAKKLCEKRILGAISAHKIYYSGNYTSELKSAYAKWQTKLGYKGKDADGVPGKTSLSKLGLKPYGY
jgi:hypothetical protein